MLDKLINNAKKDIKTICLVEYDDKRTIDAIKKVNDLGFAKIILVGKNIDLKDYKNITVIDPDNSKLTKEIIDKFYEIRKEKGITYDDAIKIITTDYLYYGCMLVYLGYADGMVAGATHSSASVLRSALQTVKTKNKDDLVSAFFLMDLPNKSIGENGILLFADCGLIQNPTSDELIKIAYSSSKTLENLIEATPKIAFLSHSTNGSSKCDDVYKVNTAANKFKKLYPNIISDGEIQLDVALCKEVQEKKYPNSNIKGDANILIFPDLDAGNIGYKLTERLGNAKAYGPITQNIRKPINDLSRGCNSDDIVGTIAITCLQAKNNNLK